MMTDIELYAKAAMLNARAIEVAAANATRAAAGESPAYEYVWPKLENELHAELDRRFVERRLRNEMKPEWAQFVGKQVEVTMDEVLAACAGREIPNFNKAQIQIIAEKFLKQHGFAMGGIPANQFMWQDNSRALFVTYTGHRDPQLAQNQSAKEHQNEQSTSNSKPAR